MKHQHLPLKTPNHLPLYYDELYCDLPVMIEKGPCIEPMLEELRLQIGAMCATYSRFLAIRIDLRFPRGYPVSETDNRVISRYIDSLKGRLTFAEGANHHGLRVFWTRERGERNDRLHYHALLLFNGHAYRYAGDFSAQTGLFGHIMRAWASALGLSVESVKGLVHVGEQWMISTNRSDPSNYEAIQRLFYAASYLCKYHTKAFTPGVHNYGSSRLPKALCDKQD